MIIQKAILQKAMEWQQVQNEKYSPNWIYEEQLW